MRGVVVVIAKKLFFLEILVILYNFANNIQYFYRYSKHLSRKGLKEQLNNPEMQVDGVSSPIQQSVEKLRISSKVGKSSSVFSNYCIDLSAFNLELKK